MFTIIVMTLLIVWAVKEISKEIGLGSAIGRKIDSKLNGEDD